MAESIDVVVNVVECLFYLVTGIVALLTYIGAKKTILQPIKTEVFKYQVDVFTQIMKLFNSKSEVELRNAFGMEEMLQVNIVKMIDSYARVYFNWNINEDNRPYNKTDCPASIITFEYAERYLMLPGLRSDSVLNKKSEESHKSKEAIWAEYIHGEICKPKQNVNMLRQLDEIMQSPFLTSESMRLLKDIKSTVESNMTLMGTVLTEVAQELPYLYPSEDELKKIDIAWIENRYNQIVNPIDKHCAALINYLREYYRIESVMK